MAHACSIARETMDAVAPLVVPGTSMVDLVEAVEHELGPASRGPSFPTHIFTWGERGSAPTVRVRSRGCARARSSSSTSAPSGRATAPLRPDGALRRAADEYERVTRVLLDAQEAGTPAAVPGALARDVNAACRAIEAAGLGDGFRHRMGHGIGLDVHERPFLSVEDETPLEAGMTFTDEPSILLDGRFGCASRT